MPKLRPIISKAFITTDCHKSWKMMFPYLQSQRATVNLPVENIYPEHFVKIISLPVELMIMCLLNGAWVRGEDWKPYVRYAIANRLLNRKTMLFTEQFEEVKDDFMDFQLNGGDFKRQKRLKGIASRIIQNPLSTTQDQAVGKLILSTMDEIQLNTLIQPFHWIRAGLAASESSQPFGVALHNSEMTKQKATLCKMLRSS